GTMTEYGRLADADQRALDDLQRTKALIDDLLTDNDLPAHVRSKLLSEARQYVLAIAELERKRPQPRPQTKADELRERRAARHRAIREQYGTTSGEANP